MDESNKATIKLSMQPHRAAILNLIRVVYHYLNVLLEWSGIITFATRLTSQVRKWLPQQPKVFLEDDVVLLLKLSAVAFSSDAAFPVFQNGYLLFSHSIFSFVNNSMATFCLLFFLIGTKHADWCCNIPILFELKVPSIYEALGLGRKKKTVIHCDHASAWGAVSHRSGCSFENKKLAKKKRNLGGTAIDWILVRKGVVISSALAWKLSTSSSIFMSLMHLSPSFSKRRGKSVFAFLERHYPQQRPRWLRRNKANIFYLPPKRFFKKKRKNVEDYVLRHDGDPAWNMISSSACEKC